ncbi:MAG TPA: pyridoxal phosphate-dependent aminotransferase family protein [Chloroflexi bacterium]|jgi:8-amino-7-oxononanoate synthase|nr:pyridoxal phosphate-dependent aminotransferase family protein [Chloroflexota bacterium]
MDLFEKCYCFTRAAEARAAGYYPYFIPLEDTEGTEVVIDGKRMIMIGSNNYLGLTTHPKVRQAMIDAVKRYGTSCTGSRFLNGNLAMHDQLEQDLADFVGKEAGLIFSTGMQTNLGTISALVGRDDVVITDREDHASIIDACRLSFGEMKRFRHNDTEHLERVLESCDDKGKLVVVDGVFSMGGDIAPLPEIVSVCEKYGARLMVDDAHSLGVLAGGRGTAAHFGLTDKVDLTMGTFSKSFASLGGVIVGDAQVIDYIKHHARSLIFSASMPPANVAAVSAALQVMKEEPERVERVQAIGEKMRQGYQAMGFNTGDSQTPIIPIFIGDEMKTFAFWKALFEAGIYVNPVVPPAVPPNQSLLRTSYMATHTDEQLDRVLNIFGEVGRALDLIP